MAVDPTGEEALGRYLVNGPGHCVECHSPRDFLGGVIESRRLDRRRASRRQGQGAQHHRAGPEELVGERHFRRLATGFTPLDDVLGSAMTAVVRSLSHAPAADLAAIAHYLKTDKAAAEVAAAARLRRGRRKRLLCPVGNTRTALRVGRLPSGFGRLGTNGRRKVGRSRQSRLPLAASGSPHLRRPALASASAFEASRAYAKEADMKMNLAYAALLGTALAASPALAQQAGGADPAPAQTQPDQAAAPPAGQVIDKQSIDEWRAPKLVGVDVYGPDNKAIGKIKDLLMGHDGKVHSVVIGVGGFLGIGEKDVAVPFEAVHWSTEGRNVPTESSTPPAAPLASTTGAQQPAPPPAPEKTDPAATEASQGYPDKAVIDMTLAQLKAAPDFKYAPNPTAEAAPSGSQNAAEQRAQPQPPKP